MGFEMPYNLLCRLRIVVKYTKYNKIYVIQDKIGNRWSNKKYFTKLNVSYVQIAIYDASHTHFHTSRWNSEIRNSFKMISFIVLIFHFSPACHFNDTLLFGAVVHKVCTGTWRPSVLVSALFPFLKL